MIALAWMETLKEHGITKPRALKLWSSDKEARDLSEHSKLTLNLLFFVLIFPRMAFFICTLCTYVILLLLVQFLRSLQGGIRSTDLPIRIALQQILYINFSLRQERAAKATFHRVDHSIVSHDYNYTVYSYSSSGLD